MHQGDILPGMRPIVCSECALRVLHSKGTPFAVRERASKTLRPGFFGCVGEQKIVIAALLLHQSATSVPWGSGRYSAAELQAPDVAIDANGDGAGGA